MRYFLDCDNDCHHYVIPVDRQEEWEAWLDLDSDDEASWNVPLFAVAVGGSPSLVTFENFIIG